MSPLPKPAGAPDSPRPDRQLDEVCDRFEAACKAATATTARPRIEEYLAEVPAGQRLALLPELVLLDADYRRLAGECPRPEEYLARFPELDPGWLAAALAAASTSVKREVAATDKEATLPDQSAGRCERDQAQVVPSAVGGYRVLGRLGGGGMGAVYEAEEIATGRRVALKFLATELADSPEAVARFRAEGRLASAIAHPRCVFVLAADEDAGRPYIVMELMPGDTLADLVRRDGPLATEQAIALALDVIDGLLEAHASGVIHRDVKPSNCFVTAEGRVKIGDFGLAKSLSASAHLTKTGTFLGTPQFASPEQIKGLALDTRTDVYSLAATLYYLLTGQAPFEGSDAMAVMARIVSDLPPPVRARRPDVPPGLERLLLRALERDRDRRPSLTELRSALVPFGPQPSMPGSPGWRFIAIWLDGWLFMLLSLDFGLLGLVHADPASQQVLILAWNGLWIVYFAVLEGIWGWSVGKLLLGLRVTTAAGNDPPGIARALVRSLGYFALVYAAATVFDVLSAIYPDELWLNLASALATLVGMTLLLSTMRKRSGYRGPHELGPVDIN